MTELITAETAVDLRQREIQRLRTYKKASSYQNFVTAISKWPLEKLIALDEYDAILYWEALTD